MIIDFHSHILPRVDDGSQHLATSVEMMQESLAQGVSAMVATPHFYAHHTTMERFLTKREAAYERLLTQKPEGLRVCLGAEVLYFDGIAKAEEMNQLVIQGTNLFLLEMPMKKWDEKILSEVERLVKRKDLQVMVAHLDRYLSVRGNRKWIEELLRLPVFVQINAESLCDFFMQRKVLPLIKEGKVHVLGSDCHNMKTRKPNLIDGRERIEKKLGTEVLDQIDRRGMELLGME